MEWDINSKGWHALSLIISVGSQKKENQYHLLFWIDPIMLLQVYLCPVSLQFLLEVLKRHLSTTHKEGLTGTEERQPYFLLSGSDSFGSIA